MSFNTGVNNNMHLRKSYSGIDDVLKTYMKVNDSQRTSKFMSNDKKKFLPNSSILEKIY